MWNNMKGIVLAVGGTSFGLLAAAGVFTVLVAVGLVPRFAGKTHTGKQVIFYEEMVIAGTAAGGVLSLFENYFSLPAFPWLMPVLEKLLLGAAGLFAGMFVGCLALAIAEMLDSIPIFARRVQFRHGLGIAIIAMAIGKLTGSLLFFAWGLHDAVK